MNDTRDREFFAQDTEAPITSLYVTFSGPHVVMTVRWYGKTSGTLIVDAKHFTRLRDALLPGGWHAGPDHA